MNKQYVLRRLLYTSGLFVGLTFCVDAKTTGLDYAAGSLRYDSVWTCDQPKSNWYCDEEAKTEPPQAPQKPVVKAKPVEPPRPKTDRIELKDLETAEQLRAELKRREDVAVMKPTPENIKDYLDAWQLTQNTAAKFADSWQRVVWQNPQYDYSLKHPTNNAALNIAKQQKEQTRSQALAELSKHHGLIFFFRSDCTYCHTMSSTLRVISERFGMEVLPVSIDGQGMPQYPNFVDGRGIAAQWGVEVVPAVFIASKDTKEHAPIGFGVMSFSELTDRIFVLTNTKVGDNF
jgi:conjugal transfer pilus assembly protein TraF